MYRYFYPAGTVFKPTKGGIWDWNIDLDVTKLRKNMSFSLTIECAKNDKTDTQIFSNLVYGTSINNRTQAFLFNDKKIIPRPLYAGETNDLEFWFTKYGTASYITVADDQADGYRPITLKLLNNHN